MGNFACNLGQENALFVELMRAILAIEQAIDHNWTNMWLEIDSKLVVLAFSKSSIMLWKIRYRWDNCMNQIDNFNFLATHIYREENHCAYKLANLVLEIANFTWWNDIHLVVESNFHRNKLGLPNFRLR